MNQLSWFLYFADVVSGLGLTLGMLSFVCLFAGLVWLAIRVETEQARPLILPIRLLIAAFPVGLLLANVIPGKNTMYAIAASELGEQVVTSDTGKKVASALEAWLDKQLEGVGK
jgi:hypothetical protein